MRTVQRRIRLWKPLLYFFFGFGSHVKGKRFPLPEDTGYAKDVHRTCLIVHTRWRVTRQQ
jgi:hypothetical protein